MRPGLNIMLAAFVCAVWLTPADPGWAQEEAQQERKTRRALAMSEKVHRRLSKAKEAYDEEDYAVADQLLREILEFRNLSPYETAQTNSFFASVYIVKEDLPSAIDAFLRVVEVGGPDQISPGLYQSTIRTLAQLYMQVENFTEAVKFARLSLSSKANPQPKDYLLLGLAHLSLEQWEEALDNISLAIESAQSSGAAVEENWWRYMVRAHWELEEFAEALEITRMLLTQWPKKSYWMQLQALYSYVENEPKQFVAYWCAYEQGMLTSSRELVGMAQLFMQEGVPYKAAVVLQVGIDSGAIEDNAKNYRLLAQAWQMAREDRKALVPLRKAAESGEDKQDRSTWYVRLAESHNALSEYDQCASATRQAIHEGNLKNEGRTYMLLGQCLFEQEEFEEASDAFSKAARDSDYLRAATRWQNYLKTEVVRRRDLEARLAQYAN